MLPLLAHLAAASAPGPDPSVLGIIVLAVLGIITYWFIRRRRKNRPPERDDER